MTLSTGLVILFKEFPIRIKHINQLKPMYPESSGRTLTEGVFETSTLKQGIQCSQIPERNYYDVYLYPDATVDNRWSPLFIVPYLTRQDPVPKTWNRDNCKPRLKNNTHTTPPPTRHVTSSKSSQGPKMGALRLSQEGVYTVGFYRDLPWYTGCLLLSGGPS